jgi:glycosidase
MITRRQATLSLAAACAAAGGAGCTSTPHTMNDTSSVPASAAFAHVPWSQQTNIYEVNVRQFTPEGTLAAFEAHLPRLAQMGVGMLWFMPVQPIGVKNRKGGLGSYYSISDYTAINPEFGTLADFQRVVQRAHALGMKVILDWVANHTAWDHPWVAAHRHRYKLDAQGQVFAVTFKAGTPDVEYWTDVVGLDYSAPGAQQDLWPAMTEAMAWWLRTADIDGFRCDVASLVPTPFWEQARVALDAIKPVFMLAESDAADLHARAFDMTYDWDLFDQLRAIAQGKADARAITAWWQRRQARYPADAYRMNFTANHDSNSWHGSCKEFYGSQAAFKAMAVLAATLPGMPLIYGGQEGFFDKRLAFFEKDLIDWRDYPLAAFYAELLNLKNQHAALANGPYGGALLIQDSGNPHVLAFARVRGASHVQVAVNLGGQPQTCRSPSGAPALLQPWAWSIVAV